MEVSAWPLPTTLKELRNFLVFNNDRPGRFELKREHLELTDEEGNNILHDSTFFVRFSDLILCIDPSAFNELKWTPNKAGMTPCDLFCLNDPIGFINHIARRDTGVLYGKVLHPAVRKELSQRLGHHYFSLIFSSEKELWRIIQVINMVPEFINLATPEGETVLSALLDWSPVDMVVFDRLFLQNNALNLAKHFTFLKEPNHRYLPLGRVAPKYLGAGQLACSISQRLLLMLCDTRLPCYIRTRLPLCLPPESRDMLIKEMGLVQGAAQPNEPQRITTIRNITRTRAHEHASELFAIIIFHNSDLLKLVPVDGCPPAPLEQIK